MKTEIAEKIVKAGEDLGFEIRLIPDYSGRGMVGRTTAAVVVESVNEFTACVASVAADKGTTDDGGGWDIDTLVEEMKGLRTDSLGYDVVLY